MASKAKGKRILVTSALPYANGSIHIGHLVEYIQTDIFVRFLKLIGEDAIYCCADDTHGTPISIKAEELGISPEELIAKFHKEHLEDFSSFHIEFDSYYSTNSPENEGYATQIFKALQDKGLIYQKEVENFYDETKKRFLPDRYVKGECPKCGAKDQYGDVCESCGSTHKPTELVNPYSTLSNTTPIRKSSTHYFFKLSSLSDKLDAWLGEHRELQPEIVNYVRNWIKEGLQDWDISRDGPYFGFKIPGEEEKYFYVWLDAPIGYISSTQNWCKQKGLDAEKEYWKNEDSRIIHVIGKDIMYFHFLFWPAMLMESGFKMPDNLLVHGFLTVNGEKMSKSRGTFLTAKEFLKLTKPEFLRFYYAGNLSHTINDIDLNFQDLQDRINNELVANIANFFYRVLSFTEKNFDGKIEKILDKDTLAAWTKEFDKVKGLYGRYEFRDTVKQLMHISSLGNRYFQEQEPWKLIKEDKESALEVLTLAVNLVKDLTIALKPILPVFCSQIEQQLGVEYLSWEDIGKPLEDHQLGKAAIIFKNVEIQFKPMEEKTVEQSDDPFNLLNLKVAEIKSAKDHPNANKLMVMDIELGTEQRQLVAGIKGHYTAEELVGKKIVVVSNLKPAVLRGVESQGMLLAGSEGEKLVLVDPEGASAGDSVFVEGSKPNDSEITIDDFAKVTITAENDKVIVGGKELCTEKGPVVCKGITKGTVS